MLPRRHRSPVLVGFASFLSLGSEGGGRGGDCFSCYHGGREGEEFPEAAPETHFFFSLHFEEEKVEVIHGQGRS